MLVSLVVELESVVGVSGNFVSPDLGFDHLLQSNREALCGLFDIWYRAPGRPQELCRVGLSFPVPLWDRPLIDSVRDNCRQ